MARTLFFHKLLRKFMENTNNKPIFSQCNIFDKCKYFFSIGSNVVCVVTCLVFVFYCALNTGRCNAFQHIFVNQKKSEFYGPCFQICFFLWLCWYTNLVRRDTFKRHQWLMKSKNKSLISKDTSSWNF